MQANDPPVADSGGPYVFGEDFASFGVWTVPLDGTASSDDFGLFDFEWLFDPYLADDFAGTTIDPNKWDFSTGVVQNDAITVTGAGSWTTRYLRSVPVRNDGIIFEARLTTAASGTQRSMWGLKSTNASTSYTVMPYAIYFNNGTIGIYENGTNRGNFSSFTRGLPYDIRITQNSTGVRYEFKAASDADYTLLREAGLMSSTPLHVHGTVLNGSMTVDDVSARELIPGPTPTIAFDSPGVTNVTLRVRDNALQEAFDTTTITIEATDPPVADAGGPYTVEVGSMNVFNGTGSTDDVAIEQYDWVFGDTTGGASDLPFVGRGATASHHYQEVGTYNLSLTVTDNAGQTDTDTTTVDVIVGSPPVAAIGVPTSGAAGGPPVYFDAGATADDFGVIEYRWDFDDTVDRDGDGNFTNDIDAVGARPFHTYAIPAGPDTLVEPFDGTTIDPNAWLSAGATQDDAVTVVGAGSWGNRYFFSNATYPRSITFEATITPENATGNQHVMIGLKDTNASFSFNRMPHAIYFNNDNIHVYEQGSNRGVFGAYTRGDTYDVRIEVKPSGGATYFFRENGTSTWTQLHDSTNRTEAPLRVGLTVHSGTIIVDNFRIGSQRVDPYTVTLTVEDGAGQTDTATIAVPVAIDLPPNVITVPWVARDPIIPHETYDGKSIRLKGIVRDASPATFQWDFGDGTSSAVMNVTNPFDLSVAHTYPAAPAGTPFTAVLKVWDGAGQMGQDTYNVVVRPRTLNTEVNIAIDEGLWYLHQQQTRTTAEGYDTGFWTSNARASATASSIQAFEINGHTENVNHAEDPYAETVMRGLRQLFRDLGTVAIATQTYGEPDTDGNDLGIQTGVSGSGGQPIYQGGQVMDAIASSGSPLARTITGGTGIKRRSYFDILTDMSDQFGWGQTEQGQGGAWRYSWNSSIDNSAAQWGAIGMLASEDVFGIPVPPWVKERNRVWLDRSYSGLGWGYTSGTSRAGTPSGMVQWIFSEGKTSDGQWQTAEKWMADNWTSQFIINPGNRPYYPYFALTKAMRLAEPKPVVNFASNGFDWFNDPTLGLARTLVDDQMANGQFPGSEWITGQLRSAWGVIILSQTLFVLPPVADAGRDRAWAVDRPLPFDASGSFHLDPFRSIVQYEWDFDGDGTFDATTSDPIIEHTYTSIDYPIPTLPRTFTVTLRVTDDQAPALTDTDTVNIIIAEPPHPPVAEAGGPYTCTAGLPCQLDGSGSFDIDPFDKIVRWEWELDSTFPFDFDEASGEMPIVTFDTPGIFDIGLRVWDDGQFNDLDNDGEVDENERLSDQHFVKVTVVQNLAPVADANGPYTVDEGSTTNLDASGSSDPNDDPLTYAWDLDDDGVFDDATGVTPAYTGIDDGTYPVSVEASDGLLTDIASSTVIVNNVAPTVDAGPDQTPIEGSTVNFAGSFTDPGTQDTHTIEWDFGDGSAPVTGTLTPTHVYPDNSAFVVTLTVTDDDGGVGSDTLNIVVGNAIPVVDAGPDATIDEGDTFVSAGSFTDPGSDTWTATVDYGDGSGPQPLALNPDKTFALDHTYADNGVYTVTVTVTDDDGGVGVDTAIVTVNNVAPVVEAGPDAALIEGDTFASAGSFTDPGADTWTATVDYGEGAGPIPLPLNADGTFALSNLYEEDGIYTVTVAVTDDDGGVGIDTATVTVGNAAPIVEAGADQSGATNETIALDPATFTDAGVLDTHIASIDWGDGTTAPGTVTQGAGSGSVDATHVYTASGTFTVSVTVTDDDGGVGSDTLTVIITSTDAPIVNAGPDATLTEGDTFASAGSFTDPDSTSWTATVDYGEGAGPQTLPLNPDGTFALSNTYEQDGVYTVTVTVTDDSGLSGSDTATVTVGNANPAVDAGPDTGLVEGDTLTSAGSFVDPGVLDAHTATVDYGEGAGSQSLPLNPDGTFALSNLYEEDGIYTVTVTVNDADGGSGTDTATVTVSNANPIVEAGANQTGAPGDSFSLDPATFTDAGVLDTHTATIDWGDGTPTEPGVVTQGAGSGSVDGSHSYPGAGTFTVTVTVTDDEGASGSDTFNVTIVELNPPAVDAGVDTSVNEGDTFSGGGVFIDPDSTSWTATVDYGEGAGPQSLPLNPDGSFALSNLYEEDGVYTILVAVTDDSGLTGSDSLTVTVNNLAPVVEAGANQTGAPGDSVSLDPATFTDAGVLDTHTATIDWGDGTPTEPGVVTQGAGSGSVDGSHSYPGAGTFTVTVTVTDDEGASGSDTFNVTIVELNPPAVDAGVDTSVNEGDTFSGGGVFIDPDSTSWTATVDYGEGAGPQSLPLNPDGSFALSNLYEEDGVYTILVAVTDDSGLTGSDSLTVTVNNVAPVVDAGPDGTISEGDTFASSGSFTDPGVLDTHTATVDYGDGSGPQSLPLNPDKTFALSHVYTSAGSYTVTVVVTDDEGASGSDTAVVTVEAVVGPPDPPADLTARAKDGKIQLVWTHTGADSYNVYRSEIQGGPHTLIANTTSTYSTYLDQGLTNGTTYYYVVTSIVGGVESVDSNEASDTPRARRRR